MNHMIATQFEFAQEAGKHIGGPLMVVVEQDHAAFDRLEAGHDQVQLDLRRHLDPVGRP